MENILYIRVDGNEQIGTGHIMRCLAIAETLRRNKTDVVFIVADTRSESLILNKGFKTICLNTIWNKLDSEIEIIAQILVEENIRKLLIDDYFVTENYLKRLSALTNIFYIDDMNDFIYPVSTVINCNFYAEDLNYIERYRHADLMTKFYLGPSFAPLRAEFIGLQHRKYHGLNKILITSGGTDKYNVIGNILECLMNDSNFRTKDIYCILGKFNFNQETLIKKYGLSDNVHLLSNVTNMSELMLECDVCITAGGTTVYELCACGIPSIIYRIADNQIMCSDKLSEIKLIHCAGDVRYNMTGCLDNIVSELMRLNNRKVWESISYRMQEYVDGRGCERIAKILLNSD